MSPEDVEAIYEAMAGKLDEVDPVRREVFLAKLALLLSRDLGDAPQALRRIDDAAMDLDV